MRCMGSSCYGLGVEACSLLMGVWVMSTAIKVLLRGTSNWWGVFFVPSEIFGSICANTFLFLAATPGMYRGVLCGGASGMGPRSSFCLGGPHYMWGEIFVPLCM